MSSAGERREALEGAHLFRADPISECEQLYVSRDEIFEFRGMHHSTLDEDEAIATAGDSDYGLAADAATEKRADSAV